MCISLLIKNGKHFPLKTLTFPLIKLPIFFWLFFSGQCFLFKVKTNTAIRAQNFLKLDLLNNLLLFLACWTFLSGGWQDGATAVCVWVLGETVSVQLLSFFTMLLEFNYLNIKTSFRRCLASCLSFCKISPLRISKLNLPAEMVETDRKCRYRPKQARIKTVTF